MTENGIYIFILVTNGKVNFDGKVKHSKEVKDISVIHFYIIYSFIFKMYRIVGVPMIMSNLYFFF
jgi:hypothetical protein